MHKIPTLAACLVLAAATLASARPLTPKEQGYVRSLSAQIGLEQVGAKALSSKRGAAGVKVRFEGLTVVRLHFSSARAAQRYAARPSLRSSARLLKRVDLRGKEVVLLGGPRLEDPADARTYLGAAWGASLDAPSVVPGPPELRRADGTRIQLRPIARVSRPRPVAPTSATLAGTYYLVGSSRVVIDQVRGGPDGATCRVRFEEPGVAARSLPAVFDGQTLVIKLRQPGASSSGKHLPSEVVYVWTPDASGVAAFVRSGVGCELLPAVSERFWQAR